MSHDEDSQPSWMDEENDENHSLLFGGSANPSLGGGDEEEQQSQRSESVSRKSRKSYGATERDGDDDENFGKSKKLDASDDGDDEIQDDNTSQEPRRNVVLAAFNFIEGFGIVASISLLLTQLMPLFFAPVDEHGITDLVLKFYISIFCVLFIMVENDTPIPFIKKSTILQNYFSRGFVYSFIGVVSILPKKNTGPFLYSYFHSNILIHILSNSDEQSDLQESYSERVKDMISHGKDEFYVSWLGLFMQVSSWMMFALGAIYMIFSLCCLKRLRDKLTQDYRRKRRQYEDSKEIRQYLNQ